MTQRDLESAIRLDALHAQAAKARLVSSGSAGRLLVHSAAARALRVGTQNSCGLFVAIVRRGLWRHISQQDEDLALQRLAARTWNGEASARGSAGFRTGRSTGAGAAGPSSNAQDDLAMAVWNLLEQVTSSRPVDRAPTPTTHAVSGPPSHQRGVG